MKIELKYLAVVFLLILVGFVMGRIIKSPAAIANPYELSIGRYQLVSGELSIEVVGGKSIGLKEDYISSKSPRLFRMDTMTGTVEMLTSITTVVDSSRKAAMQLINWMDITSSKEIPWKELEIPKQ